MHHVGHNVRWYCNGDDVCDSFHLLMPREKFDSKTICHAIIGYFPGGIWFDENLLSLTWCMR